MVALMRTSSASRKETMSRVATADPLWKMQSTHSLFVPGGAHLGTPTYLKGRLSIGQWAHNSLLTRWSLSRSRLNRYGCLSSHSSPWWLRRGSSMGVKSAATTRSSRNRIEYKKKKSTRGKSGFFALLNIVIVTTIVLFVSHPAKYDT